MLSIYLKASVHAGLSTQSEMAVGFTRFKITYEIWSQFRKYKEHFWLKLLN